MWGYDPDYDRYERRPDDEKYEEVGIRRCPQCKRTVPFFRKKGSSQAQCGNCGMRVFG